MFIKNLGHMTKMTEMPMVKPSKHFFSRTAGPISTKLGMYYLGLELYNTFINVDLWMTLTYSMANGQ